MGSFVVVSTNSKYTDNNNNILYIYFRRHIINIDISYFLNIFIYCTNEKVGIIILYMILLLW